MPPDMKEVMGEDGSLVGWVQRTNGKQILWDPVAMFATSKAILGLIEDPNRANMEAADYNPRQARYQASDGSPRVGNQPSSWRRSTTQSS